MSKVLYFDCFAGISGDMTLGALLDAGADQQYLRSELAKLNIGGFTITASKKTRRGIAGTDVQVKLPARSMHPADKSCCSQADHHHCHDNGHSHMHSHPEPGMFDEPLQDPDKTRHDHKLHRNLNDIETLIRASSLNDKVKATSLKIFNRLARAEAQVHLRKITEVHFHEVGAVDSIVDIVGTAICLDYLGIEKIWSSPLHLGSGFLQCAHGTLPVEAPATMALLEGVPVYSTGIKHELVTPTGAAIITSLAEAFQPIPELVIKRVGYGVGDGEIEIPNLLRVILAEQAPSSALLLLESNIDNMNPEFYSHLFPLLLEQGAVDVYLTPIIMKKNRPGIILSVLCPALSADKLEETIFAETTTLGVRRMAVNRHCLQREVRRVKTRYGEAQVKVAIRDGRILRASPEYEDCSRIAKAKQLPLQEVYREVSRAAEQSIMAFTQFTPEDHV
jgi:hypothetical protein